MVFTDWRCVRPDNPVAAHFLAAFGREDVPERASDAFVTAQFNRFAEEFDVVMENIAYCGPMLLGAVLEREVGPGEPSRDVLDAGCGTGLCAAQLREYARTLTGVDLSGPMLDQARARGQYDALVESELTAYLAGARERFDVVACVETLSYFGALEALAAMVRQALRPGGLFVFTAEQLDDEGNQEEETGERFRLESTGRFSHRRAYLVEALEAGGLREVAVSSAEIRTEAGEPVVATIGSARR